MNWVTIIWSMIATACLTLVAVHGLVWLQSRKAMGNLVCSGTALMVAVLAAVELVAMETSAPGAYSVLIRWGHVPVFFIIVALVLFVRLYLHAGRLWLAWTVVGVRLLSLAANFLSGENLNFRTVTSMQPSPFLGETIFVPAGAPNPWMLTGSFSVLLLVIFLVDATVTVWRRGERRRALTVGGSVTLSILLSGVNVILVVQDVYQLPILISPFYLGFIAAMSYELSHDLVSAAELARKLQTSEAALRESEQRMSLAAEAARLALWNWDIPRDLIWVSSEGRGIYGFSQGETISFNRFLSTLHPEDRARTQTAAEQSLRGDGQFNAEYRVKVPDGGERWIAAAGRVEFDRDQKPVRMRGVSLDVTDRRLAELEADQQRGELAHLSRVTTVSELSGSLAHELNQPLAIILSNAQAAQRLLAQQPPDVAEVRDILADIVSEDRRAGEVIQRLRALLKRGETQLHPFGMNEIIEEVLRLARSDLIGRSITVYPALAGGLPQVLGDRIQLQQVLLNLILNACDAMAGSPPASRWLTLRTALRNGMVRVSVSDTGCGLPPDVDRVFTPFYTTKKHGLGLGLPICRSIITAHKGRLWAEPNLASDSTPVATNPLQGARFHVELPVAKGGGNQ